MVILRKTWLIALALVAGMPWLVEAADPCTWRAGPKPSHVRLDDRVAFFRHYFDPRWAACVAPENAPVVVEWRVTGDPQAAPVFADKRQLRAADPHQRIESRLFPSQICERKPKLAGKLTLKGPPGDERVNVLVPVRARINATGALAPLAFESELFEFPCPACELPSDTRLEVREAAGGELSIEANISAEWFECARYQASLQLLGFGGQSERDVSRALRPHLVVRDLERDITRRGDRYVLSRPIDKAKLCAVGETWGFEFWGRGELQRASGGRNTISVSCRR